MDAFQCIKTMRAVRNFADKPLPDEALHRILQAGRWSGSSKNSQPWRLIVVRDRLTLERLAECGPFAGHLRGAAAGIALAIEPTSSAGEFDAGRLAQNLQLTAWNEGIGSCIAAMYDEDKAKSILGVPKEKVMWCVISFGYPAEGEPRRGALANAGRKKLDEIVRWEQW
jgi:nitroreductase